MREDLEALYFDWLCAKVLDSDHAGYTTLLSMLHREKFVWLVSMDENRAEDGKDLRRDFFKESYIKKDHEWNNQECSVLEMLIALARRAEFQTNDSVVWWFWTFIRNLGLDNPGIDEHEFGDRMHVVLWRLYQCDGSDGGMFPLNGDFGDQRTTELWYQLCHFIEENQMV